MMKEEIQFWYPMMEIEQLNFLGGSQKKTVVAEENGEIYCGHIYYSGSLMCNVSIGEIIDPLKKRHVKVRASIVRTRRMDAPLCENCQRAYKSHPSLAWQKFCAPAPTGAERNE